MTRIEVELKATLDLMGALLPEPDQIALANISPELIDVYTRLAEREGAQTIRELIAVIGTMTRDAASPSPTPNP